LLGVPADLDAAHTPGLERRDVVDNELGAYVLGVGLAKMVRTANYDESVA
jgi:hypothetical protein